jgi:hypothetical protein
VSANHKRWTAYSCSHECAWCRLLLHNLGTFDTKQEAALAYDREARGREAYDNLNYESIKAAEEAAVQAQAEYILVQDMCAGRSRSRSRTIRCGSKSKSGTGRGPTAAPRAIGKDTQEEEETTHSHLSDVAEALCRLTHKRKHFTPKASAVFERALCRGVLKEALTRKHVLSTAHALHTLIDEQGLTLNDIKAKLSAELQKAPALRDCKTCQEMERVPFSIRSLVELIDAVHVQIQCASLEMKSATKGKRAREGESLSRLDGGLGDNRSEISRTGVNGACALAKDHARRRGIVYVTERDARARARRRSSEDLAAGMVV